MSGASGFPGMEFSEPTQWVPINAWYVRERQNWLVLFARYHPENDWEFAERVVEPETYLKSDRMQ